MKDINANPVKTVLTISIGFIIVYLITKWKWAISISVIVGLIGIFSAWLSGKIHYLWMKLAWLLNMVFSPVLLGTFFYLFLFPISLLSKAFGKKDALILKNKSESTYTTINKEFDKASFENPW